ncbi:hypothetical protein B566_EDAN004931 [Ephemera danica]|nr:hypothetical protein B566_EDAN004931 [Ephemera danica]
MSRFWWRQTSPVLSTREVLNHAVALYEARDLASFSKHIGIHAKRIRNTYHDFFTVGTHLPQSEAFLLRLVQLDELRHDQRMAKVHARCLRELNSLQIEAAVALVRVLCRHYGQERTQTFLLDVHLTFECGYDATFRPNMRNVLLTTMRRDESEAVSLLQVFLNGGVNPNARYKLDDGRSALYFAASNGLWNCVRLLLQHGANPDMPFQCTTTRQIIARDKPEILSTLPAAPATTPASKLTESLFSALRTKDEPKFLQLLREAHTRSPPADYEEDDGWCTLLQAAAMLGLREAVRALLDRGMCAHDTCTLKDPPLLLAAEYGYLEVVLQLVLYRLDETGASQFGSANVLVRGDHGDTVLHLAARTAPRQEGGVALLVQLVEVMARRRELDLHATNKQGESVFSLLTELGNPTLFELLLRNSAFLGMDRRTVEDIHSKELQYCLDAALSTASTSRGYKAVSMNFECFQLHTNHHVSPEMVMLYKMSREPKHLHLLTHPLITSFLDLKWLKLYWIYFINLALYTAFIASLTTHVAQLPLVEPVSRVFTLIFWSYVLAREVVQAVMAPLEYPRHFENWLHLTILVLTLVTFALATPPVLAVLLVLTAYAEFSLLLARHPSIASYVAMFLKVSKTNLLLLAISAPFLFSFAISFSVLFYNEGGLFNTTFSSVFKTIIMATGELGVDDLDFSYFPYFSQLTFLLFVVSIEIILMNLLHALAVHDTEGIERDSQRIAIRAKIQLYTRLEAAWLGHPMDWYGGPWGRHVPRWSPWLRLTEKLRSRVRISVLPLSSELNCKMTITEDGRLIECESSFDIFSGHRVVKMLERLVTGVSLRKMFITWHEYQACSSSNDVSDVMRTLTQQIQELRQELKDTRAMIAAST